MIWHPLMKEMIIDADKQLNEGEVPEIYKIKNV